MRRYRAAVQNLQQGFTLVELLVVVVIITALAGIATPIYLNQKAKAQDAAAEAEIGKVARYLGQAVSIGYALNEGTIPSAVPGLGNLDAPLSSVRVDPASPAKFCVRTESETGLVLFWEVGVGRTTSPSAYCTDPGDPVGEPPVAPPPPESVPLDVSNGEVALTGTGTFEDTTNGTTITRTNGQVRFYISAANWQSITVTHPDGNGLFLTDVISKQGASTVGVLVRYSNKDVRVNLPSNVSFTVEVKYAGNSTGKIYTLQP